MIGRFPLNLIDPIQYISGLPKPSGIAYDSVGGRFAVVQGITTGDPNVYILDSSMATITTITLPNYPLNMVEFDNTNNRFLVSSDLGPGYVYAISGVDYSVTTFTTGIGATCRGIRISDTRVFFSCFTSNAVSVYNLSDGSFITSFSVSNACGMDITGGKIYIAGHTANNVRVYDLASYTLLNTISVGIEAYTITNDPGSDYMVIQSRDTNQLKLLSKSTNTIVGGFGGVSSTPFASVFKSGKIYLTLQASGKIAIIEKFYS